MDQHTLIAHTLMRQSAIYSPGNARRRDEPFWLEAETRRRRVRRLVRGTRSALNAFQRNCTGDSVSRIGTPDVRRALS
jgi:hypothetical protein